VNGLQQVIYDVSQVLLWPVLVVAIVCLIWVLVELGFFLYELYLRFRYRDLDALEARTLRARKAFRDGKPRTAYRYLQENNYSLVVARFLYDLIRNYQTERLAAKPLKLLQDYEFYTIKRLERTRILVRIGPLVGLMGTLIALSPALMGLAGGDAKQFVDDLTTAFSITVIGLVVGALAFIISIVRDRVYSQDISDMEYLLELLEGGADRLRSGRRRDKKGMWDADPVVQYELAAQEIDKTIDIPVLFQTPREPLIPFASGNGAGAASALAPAAPAKDPVSDPLAAEAEPAPAAPTPAAGEAPPLSFNDPAMDWHRDEDPFAGLGPVDTSPPAASDLRPEAGPPPAGR
jgi:biopolymer transport protein ExbB/TolQ